MNDYIDTIKTLADSLRLRQLFIPEIHLWMVRIQLAKSFRFQLDDLNLVSGLNKIIQENLESTRDLITEVGLMLKQKLTKD